MTSFMQRSLKHFALVKAAREVKKDIEEAGLDDLKTLADTGKSIVGTYLSHCSPQEKARIRQDLNTLQQLGVTTDMVLNELIRQNPDLAPIIESKPEYKKTETQNLERFRKEG